MDLIHSRNSLCLSANPERIVIMPAMVMYVTIDCVCGVTGGNRGATWRQASKNQQYSLRNRLRTARKSQKMLSYDDCRIPDMHHTHGFAVRQ